MFEGGGVRSVVGLAHDLLHPSSADHPSLWGAHWRNALHGTVNRFTDGDQIRHFVMAITERAPLCGRVAFPKEIARTGAGRAAQCDATASACDGHHEMSEITRRW
jgi:hypothetical protein